MTTQVTHGVDAVRVAYEREMGFPLRLQPDGRTFRGPCPAHQGEHDNFAVGEAPDGWAIVKCHSHGCSTDAILACLGLTRRAIGPPMDGPLGSTARHGTEPGVMSIDRPGNRKTSRARYTKQQVQHFIGAADAIYDYRREDGTFAYRVTRHAKPGGGKYFLAWHKNAEGEFEEGLGDQPKILYYTEELAKLEPGELVFVAEGEGCVETLRKLGFHATTSPFGAGKWARVTNPHLLHDKVIAILPDNDEPGQRHAQDVAESLYGKARSVRVVQVSELGPKDDIVNWLAARHTREELLDIVSNTREWVPKEEPVAIEAAVGSPDVISRRSDSVSETAEKTSTKYSKSIKSIKYDKCIKYDKHSKSSKHSKSPNVITTQEKKFLLHEHGQGPPSASASCHEGLWRDIDDVVSAYRDPYRATGAICQVLVKYGFHDPSELDPALLDRIVEHAATHIPALERETVLTWIDELLPDTRVPYGADVLTWAWEEVRGEPLPEIPKTRRDSLARPLANLCRKLSTQYETGVFPLSSEEVAKRIGVSQEAMSSAIRILRKKGVLKLVQEHIPHQLAAEYRFLGIPGEGETDAR